MPTKYIHDGHYSMKVNVATVEYCMAVFTFAWGMWAIQFPESLNNPAYDVLRQRFALLAFRPFQPADMVGVMGVLAGIFYTVAIFINGRGVIWTPFVRGLGAIFGMFYFGYIAYGFQSGSSPYSTAILPYTAISSIYFILFYLNLYRVSEAISAIKREIKGAALWKR